MTMLGFPRVVVEHPGIDRIGTGSRIAEDVSVYRLPGSGAGISIGQAAVLHTGVRLVIGDPGQHPDTVLRIGDRVHVNVCAYLSGEGGLEIGDDVLIGPHARLLSAGHEIDDGTALISHAPLTHARIRVGRGAWIGAGATVLQGACIGEGAVVAAGAVVRGNVPPFAVVGGIPARLIRYRKGFEPATQTDFAPLLPVHERYSGWRERLRKWFRL